MAIAPPSGESEVVQKMKLMSARGKIDTIIVGDSRITRLGGASFTRRGWSYFNFGTSGLSPEDLAMQLKAAMLSEPIARAIVGLSFEDMTQAFPFEFSRYYADAPFQDARITELVGKARAASPLRQVLTRAFRQLYPNGGAWDTLAYYRLKLKGKAIPDQFWADGRAKYEVIEQQISAGTYDFAKNRNPQIYFARQDSEARYLSSKRLSPESKRLFSRLLADLRDRRVPTLLYETGRTAAYRNLIEREPILRELQTEWRSFFRSEARGCVKFLDDEALRSQYDENDFFDAAHFIGPTADRLSERLASEVQELQEDCSSIPDHRRGAQ